MDRFVRDFATCGPIASRIVELQLEQRKADDGQGLARTVTE
jgi:hypothetical protein